MEPVSGEDRFEYWLMDMSDAIDRFMAMLPAEVSSKLDYGPDSLRVLEQWLLARYEDNAGARDASQAATLDGAARYLGETLRKNLGGTWFIAFDDPRNVFHGLPQLRGMRSQTGQICPLTLVTASLARRTGTFFRKIHDANA